MSIAKNGFAIIRERRARELQAALLKVCEYLTDCDKCPLSGTKDCARDQLPSTFSPIEDESACTDWLFLYWLNKAHTDIDGKG